VRSRADTIIALRCAVFLNLAARVGLTGTPDLDVLIEDQAASAGIAGDGYSPVTVRRSLTGRMREIDADPEGGETAVDETDRVQGQGN